MDLRVAGHEVFLTLHRTYCAEDDSAVLQAVSKFKPLMDYLTKLHTDGFQLSSLTVRNVQYIANRMVSVTLDTLFASTKKGDRNVVTESVTLTDDQICVYLPVIVLNGVKYGVLQMANANVAVGGDYVQSALYGTQVKPGSFTGPNTDILASFGIALEGLTVIQAPHDLIIGNEGLGPVKLLTSTTEITNFDLESFCIQGLIPTPLEEILSDCTDLRATVAAALLLK